MLRDPLVLAKIPQTIFSGQDYIDFALADSVLNFNDGERKYVGIFSQMGLYVGIHSHVYYWANDTRKICASAKKTRKSKKNKQSKRAQRNDEEDNYKLVKWSVYSAGAGFDIF